MTKPKRKMASRNSGKKSAKSMAQKRTAAKVPTKKAAAARSLGKPSSKLLGFAAPGDSLESWLPKDPFEFTRVFDPIDLDEQIRHLAKYHPKDAKEKPFTFRLMRIDTDEGPAATVQVLNPENWAPEFAYVLRHLRLRVVNAGEANEHLRDGQVDGDKAPMSGWKVVSWTIERTLFDNSFDPPRVTKLTDRIEWRPVDGEGGPAFSSYTWLPYKLG